MASAFTLAGELTPRHRASFKISGNRPNFSSTFAFLENPPRSCCPSDLIRPHSFSGPLQSFSILRKLHTHLFNIFNANCIFAQFTHTYHLIFHILLSSQTTIYYRGCNLAILHSFSILHAHLFNIFNANCTFAQFMHTHWQQNYLSFNLSYFVIFANHHILLRL